MTRARLLALFAVLVIIAFAAGMFTVMSAAPQPKAPTNLEAR